MKQNSVISDCYPLLQNVLLDAFKVPTIYFTPPYDDIDKIDLGIRSIVWPHYNDQRTGIRFTDFTAQQRILVVRSNLGFYNVLIFGNVDARPDFISIGPFRTDNLSPNYFIQILKEAHIPPATLQGMKYIYESMAFAQVDAVVNVAKHILGAFLPEFENVTPELLQYSEQERAIEINTDILESNLIKSAEQFSELLSLFLKQIKCGENNNAKKALHDFLKETKVLINRNMHDYKMLLHALNNYCQVTLLETTIHPSHILKQAASIGLKIENSTSLEKLERLPDEICRKYCLLVKNYANSHYSKLTKDVIAYIQLHLEEELSLNQLATYFHRNASVLSGVFSKETGQTLTQFIQQTRIQEALRLFHTTDMSVSEVSMTVGYQDFSYFSKVFSRNVGCSPRKYRQQRQVSPK